jgi:hypothetical protein
VKTSAVPSKCQVCGVEASRWRKFTRDGVPFFQRYRCLGCHERLATQAFQILFIIHVMFGVAGAILVARYPGSESGHLLLNLFWLTVFLYCASLAHEFAHAWGGQLAGFRILRVCVGCGSTLFTFRGFKFSVEIRAIPFGGIAFGEPTRRDHSRLRSFAFIGAAPAANLMIAASVWYLTGHGPSLTPTSPMTNIFVLANLMAGIAALVPLTLMSPNGGVRSDGLLLINLLFAGSPTSHKTTWTGSTANPQSGPESGGASDVFTHASK